MQQEELQWLRLWFGCFLSMLTGYSLPPRAPYTFITIFIYRTTASYARKIEQPGTQSSATLISRVYFNRVGT